LPTVALVLHADWQDDLHSPHPQSTALFIWGLAIFFKCFIKTSIIFLIILHQKKKKGKQKGGLSRPPQYYSDRF